MAPRAVDCAPSPVKGPVLTPVLSCPGMQTIWTQLARGHMEAKHSALVIRGTGGVAHLPNPATSSRTRHRQILLSFPGLDTSDCQLSCSCIQVHSRFHQLSASYSFELLWEAVALSNCISCWWFGEHSHCKAYEQAAATSNLWPRRYSSGLSTRI